ncbi:hypothetical protein [Tranquillimonas alkanivorans]|uniref:Uncharacterized protein n=1 Tax=Tranquillimonas alkanivorans TaxID=441119 RepID=A0A1I5S5I7_9RHOB|nr:hypothetical protein [Tranquillimonas alkanivorans]SFP65972.1 hypothetical protein SAMN04488047_11053 [Tranquillimonas alkanivorans]
MRDSELLQAIWRGELWPAQGDGARQAGRLMRALLPVRTIRLAAGRGVDRALILLDETELMPALPLGDVLAEELDLDVPYGSLVVVEEADLLTAPVDRDDLSYHLGALVGEVLTMIVRRGLFPLESESDALYVMACSYHRMAAGSGLQLLGLVPNPFRAGLAASLGAYWTGARSSRTEMSGLFLTPDFLGCPKLRGFLSASDAGFSAPDPARVPADLMLFPGGTRTFPEWLGLVEAAVRAECAAQARRQNADV